MSDQIHSTYTAPQGLTITITVPANLVKRVEDSTQVFSGRTITQAEQHDYLDHLTRKLTNYITGGFVTGSLFEANFDELDKGITSVASTMMQIIRSIQPNQPNQN